MTVDGARQLRVDTFFLGAAALDVLGVYVEADQVVLLATSDEFDRSVPVLLCPWSELKVPVTDQPIRSDLEDVLQSAHVRFAIAQLGHQARIDLVRASTRRLAGLRAG